MEKFGVPSEQLEDLRADIAKRAEAGVYRVWPENWRAVRIFLAMGTQWRLLAGPKSIMWIGLDYGALAAVEGWIDATPGGADPDRSVIFAQLRAMERAALDVLRNKA